MKNGKFSRQQLNFVQTTESHENTGAHRFVLVLPGPALADAGPNARPRRGAPEQWFYGVIVFSQPRYNRGRAQIL